MKIHHLNCGTMALGTIDHCLLVELSGGSLLLVDTGFGLDCVRRPELLGWTRHAIGPVLRESETAIRQIQALGYDPTDVRDIVVTHLDYDHTGGLADFPWATVHVHGPEYRAGMRPSAIDRIRYRSDQLWAHGVRWQVNELGGGDPWFGFEAVRELPGLPPQVLVVPLVGHSRGHAGVAIDTGAGWLLHAGDAYTRASALTPGMTGAASRALHLLLGHPSSPTAQLRNMHRLSDLISEHSDEVTVFCSHDKSTFDGLASQPS
jgi:glyoxylase-like metal-dependent hydrolase (beta-lactamase superfamily II)